MKKKNLETAEKFARKIIELAAEEQITVSELQKAADIARRISENSMVEVKSIEKFDFLSPHLCISEKELF